MKLFQRMTAMLLTLVMLMGVLPLGVFATEGDHIETDPIPLPQPTPAVKKALSLGAIEQVTLGAGEKQLYTFTPEETGAYYFASDGDEDTYAFLYDENGTLLDESDDDAYGSNFAIFQNLTAGKTYTLEVKMFSEDAAGSFELSVGKKIAASSLIFEHGAQIKVYLGTPYFFLNLLFGPDGSHSEDFTVTIADPTIVEHNYSDLNCFEGSGEIHLKPLAVGTTTVSVTSESGLTVATEVTVLPMGSLQMGETSRFNITENTTAYTALLTVEEDGVYGENVETFGDVRSYSRHFYNVQTGESADCNDWEQYSLKAGTYYFTIYFYEIYGDATIDVTVRKLERAIALRAGTEGDYGFVGDRYHIWYEFEPENALREPVTITSSDPAIAKIAEGEPYMDLLSPGEVQITVVTSSGLASSFPLMVMNAPELESIELNLDENEPAFVGISQELWIYCVPEGSRMEPITWASSDPQIAKVTANEEYTEYAMVEFLKAGSVTVTATSSSGFRDSCTFEVKNVPQLTEAAPQRITITNDQDEYVKFTAAAEDWYRFATADHTVNNPVGIIVYDENMGYIASSYDGTNSVDVYCQAGNVYYICTYFQNSHPSNGSFTLSAARLVPMNGLSLSPASLSVAVKTTALITPLFSPENAIEENISYQLSDPTAATMEKSVNQKVYLRFLKTGTVTLTATSESGKSATCVITVTEPPELIPDEVNTGSVSSKAGAALKFTPAEDGHYRFRFSNSAYIDCILYDENEQTLLDLCATDYNEILKLKGGKTYYLIFRADPSSLEDVTYSVQVTKPVAPTSLKITNFSPNGFVGEINYLSYNFFPRGCYTEDVTLTSSNPDMIQVVEYDPVGYKFLSPGSTVLTLTSESGLTASCSVTVRDVPKLEFNKETKLEFLSRGNGDYPYAKVAFTPTETGAYSLLVAGTKYLEYESEKLELWGYLKSDREYMNFELKKDVPYVFTFYYTREGTPPSVSLTMQNVVALESFEIFSLPDAMDYYEGFEDFSIEGLKLKGTMANGETVFWSADEGGLLGGYDVSFEDIYDPQGNYEKTVITCGGKTAELRFRITENPVDHLELVQGTAVTYMEYCDGYWVGENDWFHYNTIHPYDVKVKVVYKNGTEKIVGISDQPDLHYTVDLYDSQYETPWTVGVNEAQIHYLDKTVPLPITVLPSTVTGIEQSGEITLYENANGYEHENGFLYYYDFLDHAKIKIHYNNGTSEIVPFWDENQHSIFEYNSTQYESPWTLGSENFIYVTYRNVSCKLRVNIVENPVESIEILTAPTTDYYFGDINYGWMDGNDYYMYTAGLGEGLSFRIHYTDGSHKDVRASDLEDFTYDSMPVSTRLENEDAVETGKNKVILEYMGKTATFDINLKPSPVTALEVVQLGENAREDDWQWPSFFGSKFKVRYANGGEATFTVTKENTEVITPDYPIFIVEAENSLMEICYDFENEVWTASFMGVTIDLDVPYEEDIPLPETVELLYFDPDIKGTRVRITYDDQSTETLTLGDVFFEYFHHNYIHGYVETNNGLTAFDWEFYDDERNYGILHFPFGSFIVPIRGGNSEETPGDLDGNGKVDLDDAIYFLFHVNFPEFYPINQNGNFDGKGEVDLDDAIYFLFHVNFPDFYPLP